MTATTTATDSPVKVGDFFEESWGYDQTNVDFYQVVRISKTGKTVWLRKVASQVVRANDSADYVAPMPSTFDESDTNSPREGLLKRRLRTYDYGNGLTVSVNMTSYSNAYLWDLKPAYQTAWGQGH